VSTRWWPHPLGSLVLALAWLALEGVTPGHLVIAVACGLGLPLVLAGRWPARERRLRRPVRALRLVIAFCALLAWDVVVANLVVARAVLGPVRRLRPGLAVLPLELRDPVAVAALAHAITLTPGTLTVEVDAQRSHLILHALDLPDPAAEVARLKARYERRLLEIWSC
jgi:multicomponent K+:H+ antiporter subunit E